MWSRFRQRGKSITLDTAGPTANAKATSPTPQLSLDGSEDEEDEEEVRNKAIKIHIIHVTGFAKRSFVLCQL